MKSTFLRKFSKAVTRVSQWSCLAGQGLALLMMAVIFMDVIFRRLNVSVQGAMDITELSFCFLCFLSFSFAWVKGDHISVEIVVETLPRKAQKAIRVLVAGLGAVIFGSLCYASYRLAMSSFRAGDTTMDLNLPHGIPQMGMVVGAGLFCLQLVVSMLIELGVVEKPDLYTNSEG